jgi:hypothetical protein
LKIAKITKKVHLKAILIKLIKEKRFERFGTSSLFLLISIKKAMKIVEFTTKKSICGRFVNLKNPYRDHSLGVCVIGANIVPKEI